MSFRCSKCNAAQDHGVKPVRKTLKKRRKSYTGGGVGWEIVKEANLCDPCGKAQGEAEFVTGE